MKFKYFLRGLGAGILFATAIMLVAYMTSGKYTISDEEIISRAEKLGMVKVEEQDSEKTTEQTTASTTEKTTEQTTASTTEKTTEQTTASTTEKTTEQTTETTTEKTTEQTTETTTEKTTEQTTEATTEKTTESTTEKDKTDAKGTITVKAGMGSETVAQLMQDAGIIESASDFDAYLIKNGYANRIEIGTFVFDSSMTYQEMAEELVKKQ